MKVLAIIAEYNPFHYGHFYQLVKARQVSQADCVIVIMSGNVVQRGEFAVLDKWQRTKLALEFGADLVLELPLAASLQSADYFAHYAVEVLSDLDIDYLLFGTESASSEELENYLSELVLYEEDIQFALQGFLKAGKSYAAASESAVEQVFEEKDVQLTFNPHQSNHILGIQYIKAIHGKDNTIDVLTLPRITQVEELNHSLRLPAMLLPDQLLSGSEIRQAWAKGELDLRNLPLETSRMVEEQKLVTWDDYYPFLKYRISTMTSAQLSGIQGIVEGIENRIVEINPQVKSFSEMTSELISSRWTRASVQRYLMQILLGITKEEWQTYIQQFHQKVFIRILGFNPKGRQFLRSFESEKISLFSNVNQKVAPYYELMLRADRVYQANLNQKMTEQIKAKHPILKRD